jgi:hypothetical protein
MRERIAVALLIGLFSVSPGLSTAAENDASLEQLIVNMAHTPADHAALANYYRGKAADERAEAKTHQSMSRSYGGGKMAQREKMQEHCKRISEQNTAMAAEYEALANLHDEAAKKPK